MEHRKSILNLVKSCNKSFFKEKSIFTIHKIRASSQESLGKKRVIDESSRDRLGSDRKCTHRRCRQSNHACICKFKAGVVRISKKVVTVLPQHLTLSALTIFCINWICLSYCEATFHIFMWGHQVKVDKVGPKRKCPIENVVQGIR